MTDGSSKNAIVPGEPAPKIPPNSGNGTTCIHEPGLATTMAQNNNANGRLDSVSALVLGCRMLARDQCQALSTANPNDPSGAIFTLNLSR